jgi:hypothetical protein
MASTVMKIRGVQRGEAPLPGASGCPSDIFSSTFLARASLRLDKEKGAMGMVQKGAVERFFQHPARDSG